MEPQPGKPGSRDDGAGPGQCPDADRADGYLGTVPVPSGSVGTLK